MPSWTVDTLKEHFDALRSADQEAVRAALDAAKEKSLAHNDLIKEMQRKEALYVTKAELYAALLAVVAVVGATMTILQFFFK